MSRNGLQAVRREWPPGADDGRPKHRPRYRVDCRGAGTPTRERGIKMNEQERREIAETIEALMALDEKARQFILGYAAGVAACATRASA